MGKRLERIYRSFPIQLFVLHLRQNQFLLLCWLILFLSINGVFAKGLGIPFLFLSPEYLDHVSFLSYLIVGLTVGGLTVAFNIASYILIGQNFSFLGTVSKPFAKFSFNNSIIPFAFLVNYLIQVYIYQINYGLKSVSETLFLVAAIPCGVLLSIIVLQTYFWFTNKDFREVLAERVENRIRKLTVARIANIKRHKKDKNIRTVVSGYFDLNFKWRPVSEEDKDRFANIITSIFNQNHLNTVLAEIFVFGLILILGAFRDYPYFQIPAAASAILFITIILMFIGAVSYWFRSWAISFTILLFIILNTVVQTDFLSKIHYAFGLNYEKEPVPYSIQTLDTLNSPQRIEEDRALTLQVLNNWRSKFNEKPRMILLSVSGGGQRASYWTMQAMQMLDSLTKGEFFNHTTLISGASGGLIGAAYFRELKMLEKQGEIEDVKDAEYLDRIGKEALNPIIFSLLTNDIFIRYQYYQYEGFSYPKDRGYAFERKLNQNLGGVLDKKLVDYRKAELSADIPMLLLSPTSVNDGRKMYVSPLSFSYMSENIFLDSLSNTNFPHRSFDYRRLFHDQNADNLNFLTALRMSASFPYITPNINLPSKPEIEIMDAGLADNFGISDAVLFLRNFKDWIEENTSGVTILSIRDSKKESDIKEIKNLSITQKVFTPISNVYNNWSNIQDFRNDLLIQYAKGWFEGDLSYYTLSYDVQANIEKSKTKVRFEERASLNWRLTEWEKLTIRSAVNSKQNKVVFDKLKKEFN